MIVTPTSPPINTEGRNTMQHLLRNKEIRRAKGPVPNWLIAEKLGIHENSFYRLLRQELPNEKKEEILKIIDELKQENHF